MEENIQSWASQRGEQNGAIASPLALYNQEDKQ